MVTDQQAIKPRTIAIIIPTRDRPQYLETAVHSALATSAKCRDRAVAEVIVVDNSSTSQLSDAAEAIAERNKVRFVRSSPPGVSRARNVGMESSDAELVAFLDDDDAYAPEFLCKLLDVHDSRKGLAVAFGQLMMADEFLRPVFGPVPNGPYPDGEAFAFSLRTLVVWNTTLSDRLTLLACGGFDESISQSEDWDLQLRVAADHDVVGVEEVVAVYRQHPRPRPSFSQWLDFQRQCLVVERRGRRLTPRVVPSRRDRWRAAWPNRGRSAYGALSHARTALEEGEVGEARRFVLGAVWRSLPHTTRLLPQFSDVIVRVLRPSNR